MATEEQIKGILDSFRGAGVPQSAILIEDRWIDAETGVVLQYVPNILGLVQDKINQLDATPVEDVVVGSPLETATTEASVDITEFTADGVITPAEEVIIEEQIVSKAKKAKK